MYAGKTERLEGINLAENVILELIQDYLDAGRILYCDNFYTSLPLASTLLNRGTHLVGTLRRNRRGIPADLLHSKISRGEMKVLQNKEGTTLYRWKDKRDVLLLSTYHDVNMIPLQTKRGIIKCKPLAIHQYNVHKSGIDLSDQLASYGTVQRKGVKWYRKVALELLLNIAVVNAYILYKQYTSKKISMVKFRELICLDFLGNVTNTNKPKKLKHKLIKANRSHCSICYRNFKAEGKDRIECKKLAKKVFTRCENCPNRPAMCLPCFNYVHT